VKAGLPANTETKNWRKTVSTLTKRFAHTEFLFRPAEEKKAPVKRVETSPKAVCEPERRLWKLSNPASSTKLVTIELFALVLLLMLAGSGIVAGFAELSHVLQSDAIGYIATQAINGGS
jgi:hypothetical protein